MVIFRDHWLVFPLDKSEFQAGSSWGPVPWLGCVTVTMRGQFCVPHFILLHLFLFQKNRLSLRVFHGRNWDFIPLISTSFPVEQPQISSRGKAKSKPEEGLVTEATLALFRKCRQESLKKINFIPIILFPFQVF